MIRLVLFDIDGTLVRTGGAGVKAFRKVFATEFDAVEGFEQLKFAGRTDVSLVREFFRFHRIPETPDNFERFFNSYVFWLDRIIRDSTTALCPGVLEFLNEVRIFEPRPVIGLLTGNIRLGAEIKLRHFEIWDLFETGAFADDHEDRDKIAEVARQRGSRILQRELADGEALVVGDTPLDIRCGRAIGARVLAVATGGASLEHLQAHQPDWAVEDLTRIRASTLLGEVSRPSQHTTTD